MYLYADHIVWLTRSGFLKTDSDSWNRTANKFWLISIIANLARDFYEILHLLELHSTKFLKPTELLNSSMKNYDFSSHIKHAYTLVSCHKDVFIDTLKNSCDLFIPLTALGFTKLSPSMVGTLGAVSSLAALVTIVKPITKLVPAWNKYCYILVTLSKLVVCKNVWKCDIFIFHSLILVVVFWDFHKIINYSYYIVLGLNKRDCFVILL